MFLVLLTNTPGTCLHRRLPTLKVPVFWQCSVPFGFVTRALKHTKVSLDCAAALLFPGRPLGRIYRLRCWCPDWNICVDDSLYLYLPACLPACLPSRA